MKGKSFHEWLTFSLKNKLVNIDLIISKKLEIIIKALIRPVKNSLTIENTNINWWHNDICNIILILYFLLLMAIENLRWQVSHHSTFKAACMYVVWWRDISNHCSQIVRCLIIITYIALLLFSHITRIRPINDSVAKISF